MKQILLAIFVVSCPSLCLALSVPSLTLPPQQGPFHLTASPGMAAGLDLSGLQEATVVLEAFDASPYLAEDKDAPPPLRVGVERTLPHDLAAVGQWAQTSRGSVWRAKVNAPGAESLRLRLDGVDLPQGWKLYLYGEVERGVVFGPYEGEAGTLWSPEIVGETVIVEVAAPAEGPRPLAAPAFSATRMAHLYRDTRNQAKELNCHLDVECFQDWIQTAASVGGMVYQDGGFSFVCSGQLMNTVSGSGAPYFLTADHCIDNQAVASTLTVRWFFQNVSCGGASVVPVPQTSGATFLDSRSFDVLNDFCLLELQGALPGGVTFSGWTTNDPAIGDTVTSIHHPDGTRKRITFFDLDELFAGGNFEGTQSTNLYYLGLTRGEGTTEGGSSGGGLWREENGQQFLIGQLLGGFGQCDGGSFYGRFSSTYPLIETFLNDGAPTPTPIPTATPLPITAPFVDAFESDNGWILDGEWKIGSPAQSSSCNGTQGPASAFSGSGILGYPIGDCYRDDLAPVYATSPVYDCASVVNGQLRFQRWLGVEDGIYDQAVVEVSNDGGATWTEVYRNPERAPVSDSQWTPQEIDVASLVDGEPQVRVRFGLRTDSSVTYTGWNIDDLAIESDVIPTLAPTNTPTPVLPSDGNNSCNESISLPLGTVAQGSLIPGDFNDYYVFAPPSETRYRVSLLSEPGLITQLRAWIDCDSSGNQVQLVGNNISVSEDKFVTFNAFPNTPVHVQVSSFDPPGNYTLHAIQEDRFVPTPGPATATPTPAPTATPTSTPTSSPTPTATNTPAPTMTPAPTLTPTPTITPMPGALIPVSAGWNALGLKSLAPLGYTAADLLADAERQGLAPNAAAIWFEGGWQVHLPGQPWDDFPLFAGLGFMLYAERAGDLQAPSLAPGSAVWLLEPGWNLVAFTELYPNQQASAVAAAMETAGFDAALLLGWSGGEWVVHRPGLPLNDFAIEPGQGFFVYSLDRGSYQP